MSGAAGAVQEWFSAAELADLALPGLPKSKRGVLDRAADEGWAEARCDIRGALARPRKGRGGGLEFHASLLPEAAQVRLAARQAPQPELLDRETLSMRWDRLPAGYKAVALKRLEVIERIEALQRNGLKKDAAVHEVVNQQVREARAGGEKPWIQSRSTVYAWFERIVGVARQDRVLYLAPDYQGRAKTTAIPPEAWELYKGDYLRQAEPPHAACYERVQRLAPENGWSLPSAKTFQRRLDAEIPAPVQTFLRKGEKALAHAFPHLTRDRSSIAPMQILNLDGHTWDVDVLWPDGTIARPHSVAVQDIASGMMLAIRHDLSLTSHLVRLALGDTFRDHGLCEVLFVDNGRENAAQAISGGQRRLRWGKTPEQEPDGLLKTLGVKAIPVTAFWGQAKPIERAFRNFAHDIAKGPWFEGAYTGHNTVSKPENRGSRAIPFAEFEAIVRRELAYYNDRRGRRGLGMNGRSFAEVYAEGIARRPAPRLTAEQLRMCLLASNVVSMDRDSGAVSVEGHRYWSPELGALKRQKVIVRFDPEAMDRPAYVYSTDSRFLAEAQRIAAGSFDRASDGREHRKALRDYTRGQKLQAKALRRLEARDVAAQLQTPAPPAAPGAPEKVVALNFTAPRRPEQLGQAEADPSDFNAAWERGVASLLSRG
jgi:hypothetical protein